jgi:hypothetical protein
MLVQSVEDLSGSSGLGGTTATMVPVVSLAGLSLHQPFQDWNLGAQEKGVWRDRGDNQAHFLVAFFEP